MHMMSKMKRKQVESSDGGEQEKKKPMPLRNTGASSSDGDSSDDSDTGGIPLTATRDDTAGDDESSDEEAPLDVTFEFRDPTADSFGEEAILQMNNPILPIFKRSPSIKLSLSSWLDSGAIRNFLGKYPVRPCNISELADEIADQAQIGTVVIQEQMGDIFAFATALNLGSHRVRKHSCVGPVFPPSHFDFKTCSSCL
jgi:hypothetical protein